MIAFILPYRLSTKRILLNWQTRKNSSTSALCAFINEENQKTMDRS